MVQRDWTHVRLRRANEVRTRGVVSLWHGPVLGERGLHLGTLAKQQGGAGCPHLSAPGAVSTGAMASRLRDAVLDREDGSVRNNANDAAHLL